MNEEKGPGWELIPQEQRDRISRAFSELAESVNNAAREIVHKVAPVIQALVKVLAEQIAKPSDEILRPFATPKEWRIYKQTKKQRTKKKYRDRFIRRWAGKS